MKSLIECVLNFSEGRDRLVIDAIVDAIASVDGTRVLHVDRGEAANRVVVTVVGERECLEESAYLGIARAARLIDMRTHKGIHPRIGATDVCPFVPIGKTSMTDCIAMAENLGSRVGQELGIPVYLYAEAAHDDNRRSLPAIRAGEYEHLSDKLTDPRFMPDFGPTEFNAKSGATVIGARRMLIAWNVNLNTKDVSVAKEIAGRLRSSGTRTKSGERTPGRFRSLQGDGWYIDEFRCAQVTFNILDYHTTPLANVFDACKVEAESLGVEVTGSELVGMAPKEVLVTAGRHYSVEDLSDSALVAEAVEHLGLGELTPFKPTRRVFEFAFEAGT